MQLLNPFVYFVLLAFFVLFGWLLARVLPFHHRLAKAELGSHRLIPLDGLRGLLALTVFFSHAVNTYTYASTHVWDYSDSNFYTQAGMFPVTVFFFITGYLFWSKLMRQPDFPKGDFYLNRLARLEPPYLLACAILFLLVLVAGGMHLHVRPVTLGEEVAKWLLVQPSSDLNQVKDSRLWFAVAWTLRVEWTFYFIIPLLGWFAKWRWRSMLFIVVAICFNLVLRFVWLNWLHRSRNPLTDFFFYLAYTFSCGILVALVPKDHPIVRLAQSRAAAGLSIACILGVLFLVHPAFGPVESLALLVPFFSVCMGNTWFGLLSTPGMRFLGRISYSFYLYHLFGLTILSLLLRRAGWLPGMQPLVYWGFSALCGCVTILFCAFTYEWLEYPFLHTGKRPRTSGEDLPLPAPRVEVSAGRLPEA